MSRDKQTEIKQFAIDIRNVSAKASNIIMEETHEFVLQNHQYNSVADFHKAHPKSRCQMKAEFLTELGYRKASSVAREIFEEIETSLSIANFKGGEVYYAIRAEDYLHYKKKYIGKDTNVTTKTEDGE